MTEKFRDSGKEGDTAPALAEKQKAEFHQYFPEGEIASIVQNKIPKGIRKLAAEKGVARIDMPGLDLSKGDLVFYRVGHQAGGSSYIFMNETIEERKPIVEHKAAVLYDVDVRGKHVIGFGIISKNTFTGGLDGGPIILHVGYTETYGEHGRQGLGARRIRLMNALCHLQYGKPLYSGGHFWHRSAENFWIRALEEGKAAKIRVGSTTRYVLL